jgi:hypothetical protein
LAFPGSGLLTDPRRLQELVGDVLVIGVEVPEVDGRWTKEDSMLYAAVEESGVISAGEEDSAGGSDSSGLVEK